MYQNKNTATIDHIKTILFPLILILFCGCGQKGTGEHKEISFPITLTYWCSSNQQEIELAEELVNKWNKQHDSIQVKLQPIPASQSSEEVLLAAIAGGTTPDICSNMWPGAMDDFTSAGGLVQLDRFPDFWSTVGERVPGDLLCTFQAPDSHYYQLPWKTNPIMLMYNVNMFREAGVNQPPETYSEYLSAAEKVTLDKDGDGDYDQWMGYRDTRPIWWQRLFDFYTFYIAASGGKTLFENSHIIFNNPAAIQVFDFFREVYSKGYFPITTFQGDNFIAGRLATQITGAWNIAHVEKFKPEGFQYDIAPIPVPDHYEGPIYTYGDHKNISIFSNTHHPEAAWEFVKFLIRKQSDLRLLELCNQIPIRKNMTTDTLFAAYFKDHPKIKKYAEQAPYTRGVDGISDLKEIFDAISQEYEACAVYGARTPEKALERAVERTKVIMKWSQSR